MHVYEDKITKRLIRKGVFSISRKHRDPEACTFKDHAPFSIPQAIGLAFVLSVFLYWLPIFGPMIAGYVCGRRAGTALKGAACGLVAGLILFVIGYILILNIFSAGTALRSCQDALWNWIQNASPLIASYCIFISHWAEFIAAVFRSFLITEPGNLVILVVFGYIGGAIAAQRYRELCAERTHFTRKHGRKPWHTWKLFNSKARYEPDRYYYVKAKEPEQKNPKQVAEAVEIEEPTIAMPKKEKKKSFESKENVNAKPVEREEYTAFSDDEYYILGKAKPVKKVEEEPARERKGRGTNSLVERAMKAREQDRVDQRIEELGVL